LFVAGIVAGVVAFLLDRKLPKDRPEATPGSPEQLRGLARGMTYFAGAMVALGVALLLADGRIAAALYAWVLAAGATGLALWWYRAAVSQERLATLIAPNETLMARALAWRKRGGTWPPGPKAVAIGMTSRRLVAAPLSFRALPASWSFDADEIEITDIFEPVWSKFQFTIPKAEFTIRRGGQLGRMTATPGQVEPLVRAYAIARRGGVD
jgi:hypothetical protein